MKKTKAPELKLVEQGEAPEPTPAPAPEKTAPPAAGLLQSCPLDSEGATFNYRLPARPLSMRDVMRISVHLMSMAHDFDLSDANQRTLFSMAREQ